MVGLMVAHYYEQNVFEAYCFELITSSANKTAVSTAGLVESRLLLPLLGTSMKLSNLDVPLNN